MAQTTGHSRLCPYSVRTTKQVNPIGASV